MILSNALLVLGLSGPDLVLVSGRQAGRVGSFTAPADAER
jgi:hypothetical protein